MRIRKCKNCGKEFEVPTGKDSYLCPECAAQSKQKSVYRERVCKDCGAVFMGYPRSFYCPECVIERRKQQRRARKNRPNRPLGSIDYCERCGKEYTVNSGLQRYCPECAKEAVAENIRARKREYAAEHTGKKQELRKDTRAKRYVCKICGREFEKHTAAVTCSPECERELLRRRRAIADARRGKRSLESLEKLGIPKDSV